MPLKAVCFQGFASVGGPSAASLLENYIIFLHFFECMIWFIKHQGLPVQTGRFLSEGSIHLLQVAPEV